MPSTDPADYTGPAVVATGRRAQRREQLDAVARAITALGDLSGWEYADLAQLHYMAMELAAATNLTLAEREEPHE